MGTIPLRRMIKGQSGTIAAIKAAGELGRHLREMGLVPGTAVTISGHAPLHDPVAIRILDGTLTVRNNEADFLHVHIPVESSRA